MNFQKNSSAENKEDTLKEISKQEENKSLMDPDSWLTEFGDYLFRYALLQLKDESSAEDAVQDALMSAYRAREQFQGNSTPKTWLMTILRNKVIDIVRKKKRDAIIQLDSIDDDPIVNDHFNGAGIWSKWLNSWGSNPEKLYEQKDFVEQVKHCLDTLPENLRQVFILKNVDNLTTDEICNALSINANNVWVILYRSRMRLRKCIDANWVNQKE